jgi:hypothetical protein
MATLTPTVPTRAQLRRVCCDYRCGVPVGSTNRAHWELYLVVYNSADSWPSHQWPVARRHQVPTIAERNDALARLGYALAPYAEWDWQESETPDYHGHPSTLSFLGTISIVPLGQDQAAEGGES